MKEFEICRQRTHEEGVAVRRAERNRQIREYTDSFTRAMRELAALYEPRPTRVGMHLEDPNAA